MPSHNDQQFSFFDVEGDPRAEETESAVPPSGKHSNFVVYVDESGDHGMQKVDPHYPIFVLAFCIFYKKYYSEKVVPALEKFKFNNLGMTSSYCMSGTYEKRPEVSNSLTMTIK